MAEINLRAYVSEIEDLVEHNQLEEATAHCRHILTTYPKHLATYRLLGKALLEQGRHSDAADIFQRVHSVAPDDFLAHVGMAIIREDEANLDGAIWHMERAFEVQSSHAIIQEELRRLYGRRDGLEPGKIQYTRGALARTYLRGGLYPQAIAELQAALAEEPDRLDLQTLYAEALWRNNDRPQAAEVCTGLLEKLPFCRQANLIMADILRQSGQGDQARYFRGRAEAVDPYEAFVQTSVEGDDADAVPDHAVRVQKLQWSPAGEGERPAAGPEWMSALGISLEQPAAAEAVPDWLSEPVEPAQQAAGSADWLAELEAGEAAAEPSEPVDTGWLRALRAEAAETLPPPAPAPQAEWMDARERAAESPIAPAPEGALEPDLPDWMRELEMTGAEPPSALGPSEVDLPDWLKSEAATLPAEEAPAAGLPEPPPAEPFAEAELPDWLRPEAEAEALSAGPETPPVILPDWMRVSDLEPAEAGAAPEMAEPAPESGAEVSWVQPEIAPAGETPDWLGAPAPAAPESQAELVEPEPALPSAHVPDWLREALAAAPSGDATAEAPDWAEPAPAADDTPAKPLARAEMPEWLKALAPEGEEAVLGADEDSAQAMQAGEFPAFLQEQQPGASDTIAGWLQQNTPPGTGSLGEAAPAEEVPDWLQEALAGAAASAPESPAWMSDLAAAEGERPSEAKKPEEPAPFVDEASPAAPPPFEAPQSSPEPERAELPSASLFGAGGDEEGEARLGVEDDTLAWLEALAEKHGGDEDEPVEQAPEGEPPAREMPDWLRSGLAQQTAAEAEEEAPAAAPAELPDWLKPPEAAPAALSAEPTEDEALAWLEALASRHAGEGEAAPAAMEVAVTPSAEAPDAEIPSSAALAGDEDEALAWLETLATRHGAAPAAAAPALEAESAAEAPEPPPAEAVPNWLMATRMLEQEPGAQAEVSEAPPAAEASIAPSPEETAPAWPAAEALSAPTSAEAEPPVAVPAEELPDWLKAAAPEGEIPLGAAPAAGEEDEALAWLETLAVKHGVPDEELILPAQARREDMPDWLKEAAPAEPVEPPVPAWLAPTGLLPEILEAEPEAQAAVEMPEAPAQFPEAKAAAISAEDATAAEEPQPAEALPDWLAEAAPQQPTVMGAAEQVPIGGGDEALAWLEALATRHGAKEDELVMPAEARSDEMPSWLREAAPEPEAQAPQVDPDATPARGVPAFRAPEEPAPPAVEAEPAEAPETAFAFEAPAADLEAAPSAEWEETAAAEETSPEELPEWLRATLEEQPALEAFAPPPEAEPAQPAPSWQTPAEAVPGLSGEGEAPAWLRAAMGEDTEAPEAEAAPAPAEPLPAWLAQAAAVDEPDWQPPAPAEAEAPAPAAAAPDVWPEECWPPASPAEAEAMLAAPPAAAPAAPAEPKARRPARKRKGLAESPQTRLGSARTWLQAGQLGEALDAYEGLINANKFVDEITADLEAASRETKDRRLLRALGDAYMRQDRLQKALDAYQQALSTA